MADAEWTTLGADLAAAIRAGLAPSDRLFDALYPTPIRMRSAQFWTPVDVALRAAGLLAPTPETRVLDVGSGVGKLCVCGALATRATFVGVEQRPHLVDIATRHADRLGASARFTAARLDEVAWDEFDAFYLFNPFAENTFPSVECLDGTVELSLERRKRDVHAVERRLAELRPGVHVVTYHGFGGSFPKSYRRELVERARGDYLEVWRKVH